MFRAQLAKVLLLGVLLFVGSQAQPLRGRNRAFGFGLLGGALAGAAIGHAVAKKPGSSNAAAPTAAPVAQVVVNGVPDANGCYRQTIKEPVPGHSKLYTETVHLVCPPRTADNVAAPAQVLPAAHAPAAFAYPVMPAAAPAATHVVAAAVPAATTAANATQVNSTLTFTHLGQPGPVPVAGSAPAPVSSAIPHLTFAYATAPMVAPALPAPQGPPHVILLSKIVKKQKSAASSVNVSNGLLMLVVLYYFISK